MAGIKSFGAYIPIFRLSRDTVAQAWGRTSLGGERSVANNDEDTATMAIEASFDCLRGMDRNEVDGLFFASSNPPYRERGTAGIVAAVLDLAEEITTADYSNSLRCGTTALKAAHYMVEGRGARSILVAASDCRLGYPRSDQEQAFGDGAGAVLVGSDGVIAEIEASYSVSNDMMDVWRNPEDTFVRTWESRWVLGEGYSAYMQRAVKALLSKAGLSVKDVQKAVLPAPDVRSHRNLAKALGFEQEQLQDPLLATVGDCGSAQPLMMLAGALEEAAPGDRIVLAAYGDGVDAFVLRVTDLIRDLQPRRGLRGHVSSKLPLPSYERYLSYRGILETVPGEPFRLLPSATAYWRDREPILRCYGSRCRSCGTLTYPLQRVCYNCRARDDYEKVRISDLQGKVFTFSLDNLAGRSDDPVVVQTVVELEDGNARFYCMMTDCVPSEVRVGMPVEFTFRRIYEGAGFHNYFWKCRPIRDGGR
jgi:3-hydroxy-3-methylglutaryl CoA synthase